MYHSDNISIHFDFIIGTKTDQKYCGERWLKVDERFYKGLKCNCEIWNFMATDSIFNHINSDDKRSCYFVIYISTCYISQTKSVK